MPQDKVREMAERRRVEGNALRRDKYLLARKLGFSGRESGILCNHSVESIIKTARERGYKIIEGGA